MKKIPIIFVILLSFIVVGCKQTNISGNETPASSTQINNSTPADNQTKPMPTAPAENPSNSNYQFKDDNYYLVHYIYGLDIAFPELAFTDATQIKPEDLLMFFRYIVDREKLFNYEDWFNKDEKRYHIPVSVIEPTLKKYLNINSFDVSSIKGYDKDRNEIITPDFAQFGGDRQAKLDKKEYLGNNTIRLTATFYYIDDTYTKPLYTNIYVVQLDPGDDKYYKYLSITHPR